MLEIDLLGVVLIIYYFIGRVETKGVGCQIGGRLKFLELIVPNDRLDSSKATPQKQAIKCQEVVVK